MKSIFQTRLLLVTALCLGISPLWAEKAFEDDSLGGIKLGQRADVVIKSLGKPDGKGGEVLWEATGEWVQEWRFPKLGLVLDMSSEKKGGGKVVLSITAQTPCQLATSRGIKIGSSEADLNKAYGDVRNREESSPGQFVAGSVYGGVTFSVEHGKVTRIFIGASAE